MPQDVIEINADDVLPAAQAGAQAAINIGGRQYLATMPKDAVWASILASRSGDATAADMAKVMFMFVGAALGQDQAAALQRRFNDVNDPVGLADLVKTYNQMIDFWLPEAKAAFDALGMEFTEDLQAEIRIGGKTAPVIPTIGAAAEPTNRSGRRSAAKAAGKTAAKKAPAAAGRARGGARAAGRAGG